jgi:hypothetical protein
MSTEKARPATAEFVEWFRYELSKLTIMTKKIVASGDTHSPALFVYSDDPDLPVAIVPLSKYFNFGSIGKEFAGVLHKELSAEPHVERTLLLNESYIVLDLEPNQKSQTIRMSSDIKDDPKCQEAIVFNCIEDGMQLIAIYVIDREKATIPDTWTSLFDPKKGILEGLGAGLKITTSIGRMVIDDRTIN